MSESLLHWAMAQEHGIEVADFAEDVAGDGDGVPLLSGEEVVNAICSDIEKLAENFVEIGKLEETQKSKRIAFRDGSVLKTLQKDNCRLAKSILDGIAREIESIEKEKKDSTNDAPSEEEQDLRRLIRRRTQVDDLYSRFKDVWPEDFLPKLKVSFTSWAKNTWAGKELRVAELQQSMNKCSDSVKKNSEQLGEEKLLLQTRLTGEEIKVILREARDRFQEIRKKKQEAERRERELLQSIADKDRIKLELEEQNSALRNECLENQRAREELDIVHRKSRVHALIFSIFFVIFIVSFVCFIAYILSNNDPPDSDLRAKAENDSASDDGDEYLWYEPSPATPNATADDGEDFEDI